MIVCFAFFTFQGFSQAVKKTFKVEHQYINIPIEWK